MSFTSSRWDSVAAEPRLIRDAAWMDADRARAWRLVLLLIPLLTILGTVILSHDGRDPLGKPIGTDFLSFWTASDLTLSGRSAYDQQLHWDAQQRLFPGDGFGYEAFFYPPVFLLACLPLAMLPYFWALAAWLLSTGWAVWAALRRLAHGRLAPLTLLAFPGVYINAMHGQNGFLTTALMAGVAATLPSSPVWAGVLLGGLVFKPHLLVLAPVLLIATRRWSAIAAAAVTAAGLCLLSVLVLGPDSWRGFLANAGLARAALETMFAIANR